MAQEARAAKIAEWQGLIAEKENLQSSVKDFCKQKGLSPSQFYYYKALLTQPQKVKRDRKPSLKKVQQPLLPIQLQSTTANPASSCVRLILPNSLQCIIPRDMEVHAIKALVEELLSC